jgi:hypothetical protein
MKIFILKKFITLSQDIMPLTLFYTKGEYSEDFQVIAPDVITYNGQKKHGNDHFITENGSGALMFYREKATKPFTFYGIVKDAEKVTDRPKGIPDVFHLTMNTQTSYNGINTGEVLVAPDGQKKQYVFDRMNLNNNGQIVSGIIMC